MFADPILSTLAVLALMAAVVLVFRLYLRRPRGVTCEDSPGVRTVAIFSGQAAEFFADDREDDLLVGVRLFQTLCDGLAAQGIAVENRGPVQNAQGAECVVVGERFALVLEWMEPRWVASVDWLPTTPAEQRHVALTHQVFSPPDSPELRRLLRALDRWLHEHPKLSDVGWHRKQDWLSEDTAHPAAGPLA